MTRLSLLIAVLALAGAITTTAAGQSESDLRRENQRLQARVQELEKELQAARAEIARLRDRQAALEKDLEAARSGARTPAPLPQKEISIDESVPSASPSALQKAMTASYQEAVKDLEAGTGDDRVHRAYLAAVNSWVARANRDFKAPVSWTVRVVDPPRSVRGGFEVRVQALDPKTDTELGRPFWITLPKALARRVEQAAARTGTGERFVVRGILVPEATVTERHAAEPFGTPLIGPYAEFAFRIDVRTMLPPHEDAAEQEEGG